MTLPNWLWPPRISLDFVEKIVAIIAGLIAIGEVLRRFGGRFRQGITPPELRKFSFARYLDYEHRKTARPALFRFAGPTAADFEQGYVYFRPETNKLFDRFKKESPIAVVGDPASGKTVILRSLGYKILKSRRFNSANRRAVYLISLKEAAVTELELEQLRQLHKRAVIIVDDCHLDRNFVEQLIAPPIPQCRIVLFSRPLDFPPVPRETPQSHLFVGIGTFGPDNIDAAQQAPMRRAFDASKALEIKAGDAASEIVSLYCQKNSLAIERETQSTIVEEYGQNLMVLIWALDSLRQDKTSKQIDVSRTAATWLLPEFDSDEGFYRDLRKEDRSKIYPDEAAVIFLILASPYRYEFPVARGFLQDDLQLKRAHLDLLVKSRMLTADQEELGLPHSSLASLFVEAVSAGFLTEVVKAIEQRLQTAFPDGVLRSYVNGRPNYACRLLFKIPRWSPGSERAIRAIAENNETVIRQSILVEQNLDVIGWALDQIRRVNEVTAKDILEGDSAIVTVLSKKLAEVKVDWETKRLVTAIANISRSCITALIPSIIAQIGAATFNWNLGDYIGGIAAEHPEIATAFVPALEEKLRASELGWDTGACLGELAGSYARNDAREGIARKLLPIVSEKIMKASGYAPLTSCVVAIAGLQAPSDLVPEAGLEAASDLVSDLVPAIAYRLNAQPTRVLVGTVVLTIAADHQKLSKAIYNSLSSEAKDILHDIGRNPPSEDIRLQVEKAALF